MSEHKTVYVLIIDHRHGTNVTVHASKNGALTELHDYVKDNWRDFFYNDEPIPEDRREAIDEYFEKAGSGVGDNEWRLLEACEVQE